MRRAQPAIGLKAKGYHHFAGIVLILAVAVAMAGGDEAPAGADSPVQMARGDAPVARPAAKAELAVPPALTEPGESLPAEAAEVEAAEAETAEGEAQVRGDPPLPGKATTGPRQVQAAPPPSPSPAELDRLLAGSRARSGGVDQGDETRRQS
jgi:hypothetical protein